MNNPFKAYDVRGEYGSELTPEVMMRIGMASADLIKQEIIIGGDARTTTPVLKQAFTTGYLSMGYDVVDVGVLPTPVINYHGLVNKMENVVITGSHTPPAVNGVKFFNKLGVIYDNRLRKIEEKYLKEDYKIMGWGEVGGLRKEEAGDAYVENIKNKISLEREIKVVLDHGNGTTGLIAPEVLEGIGCEVINVNTKPDGRFPNRPSEPREENLTFLKKRVVEEDADFGCGFDGDGDRSVFVDDTGRVVSGSLMSCFFAKQVLEENNDAYIVATVDTSSALKEVVDEFDGNLVWCAVGLDDIEEELLQNNAMFASEVSNHFYFNDYYPFCDGILACCKVAETLSREGGEFSELINEFPERSILHDDFTTISHERKFEAFKKIKKELMKEFNVDATDGVKFFINDSDWVLIRPSNTEPVIRITIEARTEERMKEYFNKFKKLISKFL